jgi:hypothetical protein
MADTTWWQLLLTGAAGGGITLAGQWLRSHQDQASVVAARRLAFEIEVINRLRPRLTVLIDKAYETREQYDHSELQYGDGSLIFDDGRPEYSAAFSNVVEEAPVILDDDTRGAVEAFVEAVQRFANGNLEWELFRQATEDVQRAIGTRVRALYGEEDKR